MLEKIGAFLDKVDNIVWGAPLIVLLLAVGLFLTIRLKGIQFRKLGHGLKNMFSKEGEGHGEVSSFGALCTALSATIGTGNIVGVATAIVAGGPGAFKLIVKGAFNPSAVTGGAIGSIIVVMQKGIARGVFSNEAGLGSAPIAAAAAQTNEPVKQGLVSMLGTFFDTIIICTMTGLTIVITGSWNVGLDGYAVTERAFGQGLPFPEQVSSFILMVCLVFFAFTTILGWNYYSERCLEYLTKGRLHIVKGYRILYITCVFFGPFMTIKAVWTIADIFNGLMAIPNLIALVALSSVAAFETKKYVDKLNNKNS